MAIAKYALGIFPEAKISSGASGGEVDVQIAFAASLDLTDLEHHCISSSNLAVEGATDDVLLLLACEPHEIDGVARDTRIVNCGYLSGFRMASSSVCLSITFLSIWNPP